MMQSMALGYQHPWPVMLSGPTVEFVRVTARVRAGCCQP